ncbi:Peptide synthetase, partial [Pyrenophora tritici-repentis]
MPTERTFGRVISYRVPENERNTLLVVPAWALYVGQQLGLQEIVFCVDAGARGSRDDGFLLPMRASLAGDRTVGELLAQLARQAAEMAWLRGVEVPILRKLIASLNAEMVLRSVLEMSPMDEEMDDDGVVFDNATMLRMYCVPKDGGMQATIYYKREKMEESAAADIVKGFGVILERLCRSTDENLLRDIGTMEPIEHPQRTLGRNARKGSFPPLVHELFEKRVAQLPDRIAIHAHDGDLTYLDLHKRSTALAHYLVQRGAGNEVIVPIVASKSVWVTVALFAVMKAGAAFALLDILTPKERLRSIFADTNAPFGITLEQDRSLLGTDIEFIMADHDCSGEFTVPLLPKVQPCNLAYLLFTSGTTGRPKGIAVQHSALATNMPNIGQAFSYSSSTRAYQFSSYNFDISIVETLGVLTHGGCLCVPSEDERINALEGSIALSDANSIILTPTVARMLSPDKVPSLRTLVVGGEFVTPELLHTWAKQVKFIIGYGMAECTSVTTANTHVSTETDPRDMGNSIGPSLWVVDEDDDQVLADIGVVGELVIGGPTLARGYLNDAELTAEKFIENPAWADWCHEGELERMYKTGDLVAWNTDGTLRLFGRKDGQIKMRGQRVEIAELEHMLQDILATDDVSGVAVEALRDSPNGVDLTLAAFLETPRQWGEEKAGGTDVRSAPRHVMDRITSTLSTQLPMYMLPTHVWSLPKLPRGLTGKVDRKALRQLGSEQMGVGRAPFQHLLDTGLTENHEVAWTETEQMLAELWAEVLNIDPAAVHITSSFLELGGDSAMAMRLATAARDKGLSLPVASILESPRLGQMAAAVTKRNHEARGQQPEEVMIPFGLLEPRLIGQLQDEAAKACAIGIDALEDLYPATPFQAGLMALTEQGQGAYVAQLVVDVPKNLDLAAFRGAWEATERKLPILRTRIVGTTSGCMQAVVRERPQPWPSATDINTYLELDRDVPMSFGHRLCRRALCIKRDGGWALALTMHHSVYDLQSLNVVLQAVADACVYTDGSRPVSQKPLPDYRNFIRWLAHAHDDGRAREYWQALLQDTSPTRLPCDRPRASGRGSRRLEEMVHDVQVSCRGVEGITPAVIVQTAWAVVLGCRAETSNVVLNMTVSGRDADVAGIEHMPGPTAASAPLRVRLGQEQTVSETLYQVQCRAAEMLSFAHIGLREIQRCSPNTRTVSHSNTHLVVQKPRQQKDGSDAPLVARFANGSRIEPHTYDLLLDVQPAPNCISIAASFDADTLDRASVHRILHQLDHVMRQLVSLASDSSARLGQVSLVSPTDIEYMEAWNRGPVDLIDRCLHRIFDDTSKRQGTKVAVDAWDGQTTYSQLHTQALGLASRLERAGVGIGDKVPVLFEKSKWVPAAMLGVLNAGAAFVMLDSEHPAARLQAVARAAGAKVALASSLCAPMLQGAVETLIVVDDTQLPLLLQTHGRPTAGEQVTSQDPAYVIFTSGSTGEPKGCLVEHQACATGTYHQQKAMRIGTETRSLQFASYGFGTSLIEVLTVLLAGGTVCIPSARIRRDSPAEFAAQARVNWAILTPSFASILDPRIFMHLDTLVVCGEALGTAHVELLAPRTHLLQIYGQAETSGVFAATGRITVGMDSRTVGRPIAGSCWIVQTDKDHLATIGTVGELINCGPLVGRGYINRPEANVAFEPASKHSWLPADHRASGWRTYRTGDLVQYNSDGSIRYIGRKDAQIKLNGQRIEPGEIEQQIRNMAPMPVSIVVELVEPLPTQRPTLAVFVALGDAYTGSANADLNKGNAQAIGRLLKGVPTGLKRCLPSYMVPAFYIPMRSFPLTMSGKTSRRLLRELGANLQLRELASFKCFHASPSSSTSIQPRPSLAMRPLLQRLCTDTLRVPVFDEDMSQCFNQLGDSLDAIRLVAAARREGVQLSAMVLMSDVSLHDIADALTHENAVNFHNSTVKTVETENFGLVCAPDEVEALKTDVAASFDIDATMIEAVYPCSALQEALMAASVRHPDAYQSQHILNLPDHVTVDMVHEAFTRVAAENAILRTRIVSLEQYGLCQVVVRDGLDWKMLDDDASAIIALERNNPIGFGESLTRLIMCRGSQLVWSAHHAGHDAWSVRLMLEDVEAICQSRSLNRTRPSFHSFIEHTQSPQAVAIASSFWRATLQGARPTPFPAQTGPTAMGRANDGWRDTARLQRPIQLQDKPSSMSTSALIQASWALVVAKNCALADVTIGVTLSGRSYPLPGIESIIGPTLTTVPLRVQVAAQVPVRSLIDDVHRTTTDMATFQHFGLHHIRELSDSAKAACDFHSLLVIQAPLDTALDGFLVRQLDSDVPIGSSNFPLMLTCIPNGYALTVCAAFDERVVSQEKMASILDQLERVVLQLSASGPTLRVADITLDKKTEQDSDASSETAVQESIYPTRDSTSQNAENAESTLRHIWAEVLGVSQRVLDDSANFVELGGDSLKAIRVGTLARSRGIKLAGRSVLKYPRFSDLLEHLLPEQTVTKHSQVAADLKPFELVGMHESLKQSGVLKEIAQRCGIDEGQIQDVYPCSPMQEGLVALSKATPGAYMAQLRFQLGRNVSLERLEVAWGRTLAEISVLRTRMVHSDAKGLVQVVVDAPTQWTVANDDEQVKALVKVATKTSMTSGAPLSCFFVDRQRHQIVWLLHHALFDAWSMRLITQRVQHNYHLQNIRKSTARPDTTFVRFVQHTIDPTTRNAATAFWDSYLKGSQTTDFPPGALHVKYAQPAAVLRRRIALPAETPKHVTTAAILLASWALIVSRYVGSPDVVLGTTLAGRTAAYDSASLEEMIGPTMATVPVRIRTDLGTTVEGLLHQVQRQNTELEPFQHFGLQHIRRVSEAAEAACAFRSMVAIIPAWDDQRKSGEDADVLHFIEDDTPSDFHSFAFVLYLQINRAGFVDVLANYDPDLIGANQVRWLLDHYDHVVQSMSSTRAATTLVGDLDVFGTASYNLCAISPLKPAVVGWDGQLTYAQLARAASEITTRLITNGVGPGDFVPICMEKSIWTTVAMLAVLQTGAAFLLMDVTHPSERLVFLAKLVGAQTSIASERHADILSSHMRSIVIVNAEAVGSLSVSLPDSQQDMAPSNIDPDSPAYILFTSGSSGTPKGCIISHSAYASGASYHGHAMGITSQSRTLQFASYVYGACLVEILTTLIVGGTVCVPCEKDRTTRLPAAMEELGVNLAIMTPSLINALGYEALTKLDTLVSAGEPLQPYQIRQLYSHCRLIQAYGQSECSVATTATGPLEVTSSAHDIGTASVGRTWVVDILNSDLLAPLGAAGELYIEGPHLGQGYYQNEKGTSQAFIERTSWIEPNRRIRLFRTGDLVRHIDTGSLEYLGRRDREVKIRGNRVALAEVEHHLKEAMPQSCNDAMVEMVKRGGDGEQEALVGFLVFPEADDDAVKAGSISDRALRVLRKAAAQVDDKLTQTLPSHMIPTTFLPLRKLPLTASGKVDRITLRSMGAQLWNLYIRAAADNQQHIAETDDVQRTLRSVWSKVLNVSESDVSSRTPFQSLGGDSITAMQAATKVQAYGYDITAEDILRYKTPAALEAKIHENNATARPKDQDGEDQDDYEDVFMPLSPIQELYAALVSDSENRFNLSFLVQVDPPAPAHELRRHVHSLVARHSMLRARFIHTKSGRLLQSVTNDIDGSFEFYTHDDVVDHDRAFAIFRETQTKLDITDGPLLAVALVQEDERHLLFLTAHHLVVDFVSWRILMEDLEALLSSRDPTPTQPYPFLKFSSIQAKHTKQTLKARKIPVVTSPDADRIFWGLNGQSNTYGDAQVLTFNVDPSVSSRLLHMSDPSEVVLAALLHAFHVVFPERRVPCVHVEGHGREQWDNSIDVSSTVGWFTVLRALDVQTKPEETPTAVLTKVSNRLRETQDDARLQFLASASAFPPRFPDMEMIFNYAGRYQHLERNSARLKLVPEYMSVDVADFSLGLPRFALFEILTLVSGTRMEIKLIYNKAMKHENRIAKWVNQLGASLRSIAGFDQVDEVADSITHPGVYDGDVEDIYPCSPMQQGIALSQAKNVGQYDYEWSLDLLSASPNSTVNIDRLHQAWRLVVNRHASLRSMLVERDGTFVQMVLRQVEPQVVLLPDEVDVETYTRPQDWPSDKPRNQLVISSHPTTRKMMVRIDVSHAFMDGQSMTILLRELLQAYDGTLPVRQTAAYKEYITYIQSAQRTDAAEFWKRRLSGWEPCILPLVGAPVNEPTQHQMRVPVPTFNRLQAACRALAATPFDLITLTWALTLKAYLSTDKPVFGYLMGDRTVPVPGIQDMLGVFVKMAVFCTSLDASESLANLIRRIQEDHYESLPYQRYPLEEMHHSLDLAGTALFNTGIDFQRIESAQPQESKQLQCRIRNVRGASEYALFVNIAGTEDSLDIVMNYWTRAVSDEQATNIASTFAHILDRLVHFDPSKPMLDLDLVSSRDTEMLARWKPALVPPVERCVHDVIQQRTHEQPEALAISAWDGDLTYGELDSLATRLAQHISVTHNVGPGSFVPVLFEKSKLAKVAMLAILKAGAAYVPLGIGWPLERISKVIEMADAKILLGSPLQVKRVASLANLELVPVTEVAITSLPTPGTTLSQKAAPSDVAYVLFTSGSTGTPKGVVIEHGAFCSASEHFCPVLRINASSRVFQFADYTFDVSVGDILGTLMSGGCICVPSETQRTDDLVGSINAFEANWIFLTPTVISTLQPNHVPGLETLVLGGEPLSEANIQAWAGSVYLCNGYGPAECSIYSLCNVGLLKSTPPRSLGQQRAWCRVWIVDPNNHNLLAPVGAAGEVVIQGYHIGRGYLGHTDLTSKVFINNAAWFSKYAADGPARLYKSGDLGRFNADGTIELLGRKDQQVKLRGQRIELTEIEDHIRKLVSDRMDVAVDLIKAPDDKFTPILAAWLEMNLEQDISTETVIRESLPHMVPPFMVPSKILRLEEFPRLPSGKLNRRVLRQLGLEAVEKEIAGAINPGRALRAPRTDLERMVRKICAEILHMPEDQISLDDNFIVLGGDSVQIMRMVGAAHRVGVALSTSSVIRSPVLWQIAAGASFTNGATLEPLLPFALVGGKEKARVAIEEAAAVCSMEPEAIEDMYPCSPLQEGFLMSSSGQPGAYVGQHVIPLQSGTDLDRFRRSWNELHSSFGIMRTRIVNTETAGTVQVVVNESAQWIDTRADLHTYLVEDCKDPPADFGKQLSRQAIVFDKRSQCYCLVWTVHHAIYDGWMLAFVFDALYAAYTNAPIPQWVPYSRYIDHLSAQSKEKTVNFWRSYLDGSCPTPFPESPLSRGPQKAAAIVEDHVQITCKPQSAATTSTLLRAAWALAIGAYTGSSDIVFGTMLTGRNAAVADIEKILGPTAVSIPVRLQWEYTERVADFLTRVQEEAANVIPFEAAGLQNIAKINQECREACEFTNMLVIQLGSSRDAPKHPWQTYMAETSLDTFHTHPLLMHCELGSDDKLHIAATFDSDVIEVLQMRRILRTFVHILSQLCVETGTISDVTLVSAGDIAEIKQWNSKIPCEPNQPTADYCIHQKFLQVAAERQSASAVVSHDGNLSYRELDDLTDKLALLLVSEYGVTRETRVLLAFEKSLWMVVSMISVHKAGGAFVPLDPEQPMDRINSICQQTGSDLVLCSEQCASRFRSLTKTAVVPSQVRLPASIPADFHVDVQPSDLAFIFFTSGSTGNPKGILLTHGAFCHSAHYHGIDFGLGPQSRVLQFANHTFDVSLGEILTTLLFGGTVCIPSDKVRMNDLAGAIRRLHVNHLFLTPTLASTIQPSEIPEVCDMVLVGEHATRENFEQWAPRLRLTNAYGPAETSVWVTSNPAVSPDTNPANIGRSTWSRIYIVHPDDHNRLVPIGAPGEILIEGVVVARGYLDNSELTDAAFISDPAWSIDVGSSSAYSPATKLYKSGDMAKLDSSGLLHFIGRRDNQTKIRGQRLELTEVHYHVVKALAGVAHVTGVAVELVQSQTGEHAPMLAAFLELGGSNKEKGWSDEAPQELAEMLDDVLPDQLPRYMVPTAVFAVARLPRLISGKANRKELQRMGSKLLKQRLMGRQRVVREGREPGTVEETIMADIDPRPFTLLGPASVAQAARKHVTSRLGLAEDAIQDMYPATPLQEGFLAVAARLPGAYMSQEVIPLDPGVDVERMQRAWEAVVAATPILRTRIVQTLDFGALQVVVKEQLQWHTQEGLTAYLTADQAAGMSDTTPLSRHALVSQNGQPTHIVWTVQHALYDAWSMVLVFDAVARAYRGGPDDVPRSPPFSRFAAFVQNQDYDAAGRYWTDALAGAGTARFPAPPASDPTRRPVLRGWAEHRVGISRPSGASYTAVALVRAAWGLVLARHAGTNDVVFGITEAGRATPVPGIERLVGPTIATIPVRVRSNKHTTVGSLLQHVQRDAATALPYLHFGLQAIQRLGPAVRQACDFSSLLLLQTSSDADVVQLARQSSQAPTMPVSSPGSVAGFHAYPLVLTCTIQGAELHLGALYDDEYLAPALADRLLYQFDHVLQQLVTADSNMSLAALDFCSPADRAQISAWSTSLLMNQVPKPETSVCIDKLISQQAQNAPAAQAVTASDGTLTYAELDMYSSRIASRLMVTASVTGDVIPLLFEKSRWTLVAMLGVLKAGLVFSLLDPTHHTADHLRAFTSTTSAKTAIVSPAQAGAMDWLDNVIVLDQEIMQQDKSFPDGQVSSTKVASDPAFVVFTPSSTGAPKACIVQHSAFVSGATAHNRVMQLNANSRTLQFAAYSDKLALVEMLSTLLAGGCICIVPEQDRHNALVGWIDRLQVNWAMLTPRFIRKLRPDAVSSLATLVAAGDVLSDTQVQLWAPRLNLIQVYGRAECSVIATSTGRLHGPGARGNIGKPVRGKAWIVEPLNHHRLAPAGTVGELVFTGQHLGMGYANDVARTQEAFNEAPTWFCALTGENASSCSVRIFKTGDLARQDSDGSLVHLGPKDSHVEIDGQSIELRKFEYHLQSMLPETLDVAVELLQPVDGQRTGTSSVLVAFIALDDKFDGDDEWPPSHASTALHSMLQDISSKWADEFATHEVPSAFIPLRQLPLDFAEKTDRKMLREMGSTLSQAQLDVFKLPTVIAYRIPSSVIEQKLLVVWSQVLGYDQKDISLDSVFHNLGGDSISAMQVVATMRADGFKFTVQTLLQKKTIAAIAPCVELLANVPAPSTAEVSGTEEESQELFELSPIQRLFFDLSPAGQNHYSLSYPLQLLQPITKAAISEALATIIRRHPMLRARFTTQQHGQWMQYISDDVDGSFELKQVRVGNEDKALATILKMQRSIDISEGPLLAARILEMRNDKYLVLTSHHLVTDWVSWNVLLLELHQLLQQSPSMLPPPNFTGFKSWTQTTIQRNNVVSVSDHSVDIPSPDISFWGIDLEDNVYGNVDVESFLLDEAISSQLLNNRNSALEVMPTDVMIAAILRSFAGIFPERDVPTAFVEGHGREADVESTIGWFTTFEPVSAHITLDHSETESVKTVVETRCLLGDRGIAHFNSSMLGGADNSVYHNMELAFNYAGVQQQLESQQGVFAATGFLADKNLGGFGPETRRPALVEIVVVMENHRLKVMFMFNRLMAHQSRLRRWPAECKQKLLGMVSQLSGQAFSNQVYEFPLLNCPATDVVRFVEKTLPELGLDDSSSIEDIFPCSPVQQGLLISQIKDPGHYNFQFLHSVSSKESIDLMRLEQSWQRVVNRHQCLRSIFVESPSADGTFVQVVLRYAEADVMILDSNKNMACTGVPELGGLRPAHRLLLQPVGPKEVSMRLDINHLLMDGGSLPVILHELALAYDGCLPSGFGPPYSAYVKYVQGQERETAVAFWKEHLSNVEATHFPILGKGQLDQGELRSCSATTSDTEDVFAFCRKHHVTPSILLRFTWAMVLGLFTGTRDPCFGNLVSDRDASIAGVEGAVGVYFNLAICHASLRNEESILANLQRFSAAQLESIQHQTCPLSSVTNALGLSGSQLFNTMMSVQRVPSRDARETLALSITGISSHDPTE